MNRIPSRPIELFLLSHYLVKTLSARQRLQCYFCNFEYLVSAIKPFSLAEMFVSGLMVFERIADDERYRVVISMPQMHRNQGELAISLLVGETELYAIGFTLVPGDIFSVASDVVVLISRMQGTSGSFEEIHKASKTFRDVTPQALLFAALQGCARALRLDLILGASARIQLSYSAPNAAHFLRCYDEFYQSVDANLSDCGVYVHDCSKSGSIFDNLPVKHRSRTKAKRKLKAEIAALATDALSAHLAPDFRESQSAPRRTLLDSVRESLGRILRRSGEPPRAPGALALGPLLQISAVYMATIVGEKRGATLITTGKPGCLVCGPYPYAYLDAGDYEVVFELESGGEPAAFTIDVATDRGKTALARKEISGRFPPAVAALTFELKQNYDEIEFRLFVAQSTLLTFKGVRVLRAVDREPRAVKGSDRAHAV